ncbi:hypothetical protein CPC16_002137 [Podila verticillata]|nr:hypothetical protein CPC16_002137 [Podila verticillata]
MRISTAITLVATTLALLSSTTTARLTEQERRAVELLNPENPNYCPACIKKAMTNHFPHACPANLPDYNDPSRTAGPAPTEMRCVCVAFHDLHWMKSDCSRECTFVRDERAMTTFVKPSQMKGCEAFVDFETGEALEKEGMASKDPAHRPVVYEQDEDDNEDKEVEKKEEKTEQDEAKEETKAEEEVKAEEPKEEIKTEPKIEGNVENIHEETKKEAKEEAQDTQAEEPKIEEAKPEDKAEEATEIKESRDEL